MQWLDKVLNEEYEQVEEFRHSEDKSLTLLRHRELKKQLVCRRFRGDGGVYERLLGLQHPNLPRIFEVFEQDGECTVLEEWLDGVTAAQMLADGVFPPSQTRTVAVALCDALSALHGRGIVHRDVKPENVMLTADGRVVLIDLDAARLVKPGVDTDTRLLGTVGYAAPEQFGMAQSDSRSDLFSLGVLINVLLTGDHPSRRMAKGRLGRIVRRCTQTDPSVRYADAAALRSALTRTEWLP